MRSLEANTNKIKHIKYDYKEQVKSLKENDADLENVAKIKDIEEKVSKLFGIEWDLEDVYEDLEEVIAPMKVDKTKFQTNIEYVEEQNTIYKRAIEELNENAADLEMVVEEEQEALDNVEEHFPGSMRAMEMEEYVMTLGMAIDEINGIVVKLEEMVE